MKNKVFSSKETFSITDVFLGNKFEIVCPALCLFVFLMVLDYISGIFAAKKEVLDHPKSKNYRWNSKKGLIGIYKKIGSIFTILVAISIDYVISKFIENIGIDFESNAVVGLLVLVWFILNELLSILENVSRMGVKLPEFLIRIITDIRKDIDEKK